MACPFCEIVSGKGKQKEFIIAQNADALAVLDYMPVVEGHTLVIPKKHYESIMEIPEKELHSIFILISDVEKALLKATGAQGADLRQHYKPFLPENKIKVNHVHFHIVPRNPYDKLFEREAVAAVNEMLRTEPSDAEFAAVAKKIKAALNK